MYGITVKFKESSGWSQGYTYLSDKPYGLNQAVAVPVKDWYNVGRVVDCQENPKLKKDVKYRNVIGLLEIPFNDRSPD